MNKKILVELDGVISNNNHRRHYSWYSDDYHQLSFEDKVHANIQERIEMFSDNDFEIVVFSLRPELYRQETLDWLMDNHIAADKLLLRPDNDRSSAQELRMEFLEETFGETVDSNQEIWSNNEAFIEECRELGFIVWQRGYE